MIPFGWFSGDLIRPLGTFSHRERQVSLIRPLRRAPSPKGRQGLRIATPVCALVRNDMRCTEVLGRTWRLPHQYVDWAAMTISFHVLILHFAFCILHYII